MNSVKENKWPTVIIEELLIPSGNGSLISQGWSPLCEKEPSKSEETWGVLKTTAIQAGTFLQDENKCLPAHLGPKPQHEIQEGDILITCAGPRNRCGVACLVRKTRRKLMISGKMYRFRVNTKKAIPEFVELYLQFHDAQKVIDGMKTGGSESGLNLTLSRFKELHVPLPSINQQQEIVSKIQELFSELDKGIEELKTVRQQLKVYRQAVLNWAFQGKLTNENVKEGELPKGWKQVKTKDVIEIINNGYTPTKQYLSEGSGEVPFIKVYNLNFDGSLNFTKNPTFIPKTIHQKDLKRSICWPGDVLINIVGPPLGKVSIVTNQYPEWNINQAIVMFRPNDKVLSKYLSYFLQNPETINWLEDTSKATAGQWNVKVSTCREIPFSFCSIEEQQQIVQEIESRLSVCDKIEETITDSLKEAEALRQSILRQGFEGKLIKSECR